MTILVLYYTTTGELVFAHRWPTLRGALLGAKRTAQTAIVGEVVAVKVDDTTVAFYEGTNVIIEEDEKED